MSFDNFLSQTCMIIRPTTEVTPDRYNQNQYSDQTVGADVRCRLVEKSIKLMDLKTSEYSWVKATVLLLPPGTSILPKDRVTIGSTVWLAKQVLVQARGNADHHVSVMMEAVNA